MHWSNKHASSVDICSTIIMASVTSNMASQCWVVLSLCGSGWYEFTSTSLLISGHTLIWWPQQVPRPHLIKLAVSRIDKKKPSKKTLPNNMIKFKTIFMTTKGKTHGCVLCSFKDSKMKLLSHIQVDIHKGYAISGIMTSYSIKRLSPLQLCNKR